MCNMDIERVDDEIRAEMRVRARKSYHFFEGVNKFFFQEKHTEKEILEKIFEIRDKFRGWHSETHSIYARESLDLFLSDMGFEHQQQIAEQEVAR